MHSMRCDDCGWAKPTILGHKFTKPLTLTSGQGIRENAGRLETGLADSSTSSGISSASIK